MTTSEQKRVAIIGAGINGICALRRLLEDGKYRVTCFERNHDVGGIWLYSEEIIVNESGKTISSPVYATLRLRQKSRWLNLILLKEKQNGEWNIIISKQNQVTQKLLTQSLTAMEIEDENQFEGTVIHSSSYRHPENYSGQTVAVLGAHFSGIDISFDLSSHAKKVYICHKGPKLQMKLLNNITQKLSGMKCFTPKSVILENDEELPVDSVIYCTGYKYDFSYLPDVTINIGPGNMVCNLYKSIMSTEHENLFFMGIPREVPFFPLGDHQALFIKAVLNGTARLPDKNKMAEVVSADAGRSIGKYTWWECDRELSGIAGNFEPIQPGVKKIWDYNVSSIQTDFIRSRKYVYTLTGPDSFIVR